MKNPLKFTLIIMIMAGVLISCQDEAVIVEDIKEIEKTLNFKTDYGDYLQTMIDDINGLVDAGTLSKGKANSMIAKLNAAIKSLDKGNDKAANNQLASLVNQVDTFVDSGILTEEFGQELINDAEQAIGGDFSTWSCGDPFADERDGKAYFTVEIGGRCWMSENLKWMDLEDPPTGSMLLGYGCISPLDPTFFIYPDDPDEPVTTRSSAYNDQNYTTYGPLYNWQAANLACPDGWHLPSLEEWNSLLNAADFSVANFNVSYGGVRYHEDCGDFQYINSRGWFWTSTDYEYPYPVSSGYKFTNTSSDIVTYEKEVAMSVRCIKNE